jgi:hypothetical protein
LQTDSQDLEGCCTENDVWRATKHPQPGHEARYCCQATQLISFTAPLKWWDARQYVETYTSGNASLRQILRGLGYLAYYYGTLAYKDGWGHPARWLYDRFQVATGGVPFPRRKGRIPVGKPTPRRDLGLRPGELVRVKSYEEILATLDSAGSNRGLSFDAELVPYCGKVYRVKTSVEKFIDEKTGTLKRLKTPAVILEGVNCRALYSGQRTFCPRGIHLWWREIWLERVSEVPHIVSASALSDQSRMSSPPCLASPETRGVSGAAIDLGHQRWRSRKLFYRASTSTRKNFIWRWSRASRRKPAASDETSSLGGYAPGQICDADGGFKSRI